MKEYFMVNLKVVHSVGGDLGLLRQPLGGMNPLEKYSELDKVESMLKRLEQKF
jgi:hypothetical protein